MPSRSTAGSIAARTRRKSRKKEFQFTIHLLSDVELNRAFEDALYEAGCDDALVGTIDGNVVMDFTREATSEEKAIASALTDIRRAIKKIALGHTVFGMVR
jgi:hypothetical protein